MKVLIVTSQEEKQLPSSIDIDMNYRVVVGVIFTLTLFTFIIIPSEGQEPQSQGDPLGKPQGQPQDQPGQQQGQPQVQIGQQQEQPQGQPQGNPKAQQGRPQGQPQGQPEAQQGKPQGQPGQSRQPQAQNGLAEGQPGEGLPQPFIPDEQPLAQPQEQHEAKEDKGKGLHVGFYARSCPKVEEVVANVVKRVHQQDPKLPAALLRLFFHDCFVKGCDASILLDETLTGDKTKEGQNAVEKLADSNGLTIGGIEVIDEIKAELEKQCPRTVSCADIIAFAAREAVALAGLPYHKVPAGRRDSKTSRIGDAMKQIPGPKEPLAELIRSFAKRNFSAKDLVVLSGAHSIGGSQCRQVSDRLYRFAPNVPRDPSIDPAYADELAKKCPAQIQQPQPIVDLDPVTPLKLDNQYYVNLQQNKGLLQSDQVLANDPATAQFVNQMAADNDAWTKRFIKALIKMGRINVLVKNEGEIRINCRAFNKN